MNTWKEVVAKLIDNPTLVAIIAVVVIAAPFFWNASNLTDLSEFKSLAEGLALLLGGAGVARWVKSKGK